MWSIAARALSTYYNHFRRVAGTAAILFGVTAALETIVLELVRPLESHDTRLADSLSTAGVVLAESLAMMGVVVFAGLAEHIVEHHQHGLRKRRTMKVVRELSLKRLAIADFMLTVATLAGLALAVVPGLFVFTAVCLVGPAITAEHLPVAPAFRRAWQLTRPNFWLVARCVTLPVMLEVAVVHSFDASDYGHPVFAIFLIRALLGVSVGATIGMIEATLAIDLMHEIPQSASIAAQAVE
jgi:hypothetical protein